MPGSVRHNGSWETLQPGGGISVKHNGSWETVAEAFVKHNGSWESFHKNIVLSAGNGGNVSVTVEQGGEVGIRFLTNGVVQIGNAKDGASISSWTNHGNWITPTSEASGSYQVRYTNLGDNVGQGDDFDTKAANEDTYVAITTTRTWIFKTTQFADGLNSFTCDFQVRDSNGEVDTATVAYAFQINQLT